MQAGYPPVIIRKQDRAKYYEYLQQANEGDVRPFIRYIFPTHVISVHYSIIYLFIHLGLLHNVPNRLWMYTFGQQQNTGKMYLNSHKKMMERR